MTAPVSVPGPVAGPRPEDGPARAPLADAEARRRIQEDFANTLIVEAAAGTGKTTELVGRLVGILRSGQTELEKMVAVTFTEKAAGEMKLRLRSELETARAAAEVGGLERRRLERALSQLEVARIGTIHSLCADLLRERPVEARVDPLFEVMPEEESERLFEQAFDDWFQQRLADPPEGMRRLLRRRPRGRDRVSARTMLRDAAYRLVGQRDFAAPWRRDPLDREAALDRTVDDLRRLAAYAPHALRADDFLGMGVARIARFIDELERREAVRRRVHEGDARAGHGEPGRDHDGLEAELLEVARGRDWNWKGGGRLFGKDLPRSEVLEARDGAKLQLDRVLEQCGADLAACLHAELTPLVASYDELKRRAGKLDFLDLLLGARELVRGSAAVRAELQQRFTHLFVDEFQDTDPLQAEILLLLAADDPAESDHRKARPVAGKLFLVGDPKQSIYRFRRADVALYESVKARLVACGASLLYLGTSFRSAPSLQRAVNATFAPLMKGGGSQASYVALEPFRGEPPGQPTIVALPVPRPYTQWGKVASYAIDDSLPDAVGAFVDWLINESGWTVTEREGGSGKRVPIEARHVCLLFRRFQNFGEDVTRAYVRGLEARRVPHVLVGGRSFHARDEVIAVRNALVAIEWPDDELKVFATLHGPFFALPDEALLAYRFAAGAGKALGPLHPLHRVPDGALTPATRPVSGALGILAELHRARSRRPIADTLGRLLDATRAHAGIANWPTGEQALANVLRVMDQARRFESTGATSFRAFVERLDAEAESGVAGEAPVVEEGTEGVRIMTVHRAKGLEFPVVILADLTTPAAQAQPSRHVDQERGLCAEPLAGCVPAELVEKREEILRRDQEEAIRLAYVAATRARDLLVVPAVGDEPYEGWLAVLYPVIYPLQENRRRPQPAPGCPPFGGDSVAERPSRASRGPSGSVAPGLHLGRAGGPPVVWWDPLVLGLNRESHVGIRQMNILTADDGGVVGTASERAHADWQAERSRLLRAGEVPTLEVKRATELAAEPAALALLAPSAGAARVLLESTGAGHRDRPRGTRFGTLVHAVLAEVALDAGAPAVAAMAAAQGRQLGAPAEEVTAAAAAATAALAHPLLARARAAAARGECRRECPVLLPLPGGALFEGVVDLAFREAGESPSWTVIDFKTDGELARHRPRYETQVALYAQAIAKVTSERATGVLLSV